MISLLEGLLGMADEVPSGDKTVPIFLDMIALAFVFGFVDTIIAGRPWPVYMGCLLAALLCFACSVKWPQIKLKLGMLPSSKREPDN